MMPETTAEMEFAAALAEFQESMPHVGRGQTADAGSYTYSYADLTTIHEIALPLLTKLGFAWITAPTTSERGFVLRYTLIHKAGHREGGDYPLPEKASPQQIGSAISYGRRYCFCAVTGIAPSGEDDDGQTAAQAKAADSRPNAQPTVETDVPWFDDIKARLDVAANPTEVEALVTEARRAYREYRLSPSDAEVWKQLTANRLTELGAS